MKTPGAVAVCLCVRRCLCSWLKVRPCKLWHRLVLTRSQMLDSLWGVDYPIIDRTIDTYIKNLRKKLRLDCIVTVKGIGYKFEVET